MNIQSKAEAKPFGIKDKLGYLFGDFGNDFTFILSSSFLLKFYTDVMGVAPWIVGVVMTLARFVDGVTDITMGRIADKARPRASGKFKPWIIRMCIPVAISSFLIYQSGLRDMPMGFKIAWLTITYILWGSFFYTSINIPYGSMASTISGEPEDRQSLSTYRSMGSALAGLIIGVGVPLFAYNTLEGQAVLSGERFTIISGVFSILSIVCYLLCYFLTTERIIVYNSEHKSRGVLNLLAKSIKNRALISIIAGSVVMLLSQLTMQSMANYVYPNYYGNVGAQSVSTVVMVGGMLIAAGVAKPLARRFGKAEISTVSNLAASAVCLLLAIIRPENVWVYVGLSAVSWLGLGIFTMVSWALITDVIDDAQLKHGVREDGSIYAIYSFARKLGQAAAAGLSGLLLTLVGYTEDTAFEPSVLSGIFNISTILPAIGFLLLAIILGLWYPLKKGVVNENAMRLSKIHTEE
ncbi:MAG: MFS transporter [Clostridia bacterium]|nr:MFS transporter [Clostridia bacterium]